MVAPVVREVRPEDGPQISALHARAFGPGRFARTAYRIREGMGAFSRYCRVCLIDGRIIAAVRFTPIRIGGRDGALLLGPLAVDPEFTNRGHGRGLVREAMDAARGVRSHASPDGELLELPRGERKHEALRRADAEPGRLRHLPRALDGRPWTRVGSCGKPLFRVSSVPRLEEESSGHAFLFADRFQMRTP